MKTVEVTAGKPGILRILSKEDLKGTFGQVDDPPHCRSVQNCPDSPPIECQCKNPGGTCTSSPGYVNCSCPSGLTMTIACGPAGSRGVPASRNVSKSNA